MLNFLHLVEDPEAILFEVHRILKPDGVVVISLPLNKLPLRWEPELIKNHLQKLLNDQFRQIHMPDTLIDGGTGFECEDLRKEAIYLCVAKR